MKALEVHLTNGDVFTVDATNVTTTRSATTGELQRIEWEDRDDVFGKRKLHHIDVTQVAALVVIK